VLIRNLELDSNDCRKAAWGVFAYACLWKKTELH
jgi:hypothetical protein